MVMFVMKDIVQYVMGITIRSEAVLLSLWNQKLKSLTDLWLLTSRPCNMSHLATKGITKQTSSQQE
ncbi:unnamed protein product [Meloidogyne enterolobii]|uniref:Uncharacterized protein n=1 Tax=Meloidogyne enterolobii TaxID=390850 RepID=A0ACB1ABW3_MELEN